MTNSFSLSDVRRGYRWLGHRLGVTEVVVLNPSYRAGDVGWNRLHRAWPVTRYLASEEELIAVVREFTPDRMVCYGVNPRPGVLLRADGRVRSAREADIAVSQNLLLDIDLEGVVTPSRLAALKGFLGLADEYFVSLGVSRPFRASTGRGSHLLFGYASIPVAECPDVRERLRVFKDGFARAVRQELSRLEAKVDSTQDLRRMTRVYGTSKPGVGVLSKFYGKKRVEDGALRDYLLRMAVPAAWPVTPGVPVVVGDRLPEWFTELVGSDARLRSLWEGAGKLAGSDCSVSGYDFSVIRYLVRRGYRDPDELGTILTLRPVGLEERCTKGLSYLERTVSRALSGIKI